MSLSINYFTCFCIAAIFHSDTMVLSVKLKHTNRQINYAGLLGNSAFSSPPGGKKKVHRVLSTVKKKCPYILLENMFHLQNIKKNQHLH